MDMNKAVDITIPCGGNDPPYTYTKAGSIEAENMTEFYSATNQNQFNNGDGYCCNAIGGTTCYQLNITCVLYKLLKIYRDIIYM